MNSNILICVRYRRQAHLVIKLYINIRGAACLSCGRLRSIFEHSQSRIVMIWRSGAKYIFFFNYCRMVYLAFLNNSDVFFGTSLKIFFRFLLLGRLPHGVTLILDSKKPFIL